MLASRSAAYSRRHSGMQLERVVQGGPAESACFVGFPSPLVVLLSPKMSHTHWLPLCLDVFPPTATNNSMYRFPISYNFVQGSGAYKDKPFLSMISISTCMLSRRLAKGFG